MKNHQSRPTGSAVNDASLEKNSTTLPKVNDVSVTNRQRGRGQGRGRGRNHGRSNTGYRGGC